MLINKIHRYVLFVSLLSAPVSTYEINSINGTSLVNKAQFFDPASWRFFSYLESKIVDDKINITINDTQLELNEHDVSALEQMLKKANSGERVEPKLITQRDKKYLIDVNYDSDNYYFVLTELENFQSRPLEHIMIASLLTKSITTSSIYRPYANPYQDEVWKFASILGLSALTSLIAYDPLLFPVLGFAGAAMLFQFREVAVPIIEANKTRVYTGWQMWNYKDISFSESEINELAQIIYEYIRNNNNKIAVITRDSGKYIFYFNGQCLCVIPVNMKQPLNTSESSTESAEQSLLEILPVLTQLEIEYRALEIIRRRFQDLGRGISRESTNIPDSEDGISEFSLF